VNTTDVLIVGGGIAGASAAAYLARDRRVIVLEQESQPGYHATGRSAALFTETYGNDTVRRLSRGSRAFYEAPPDGFADASILGPRGAFLVAPDGHRAALAAMAADFRTLCPDLEWLEGDDVRRVVPPLDTREVVAGLLEPGAMDVDTHALHGGYLRLARARGATIVTDAHVAAVARSNGAWEATTTAGAFAAPVLVNAAGAWGDAVAALAGVAPLGLEPKRRTALIVAPDGLDITGWPLTYLIDDSLYFKPEAGKLLVSPADATPSPPCDAQADELDVARAADRLTRVTGIAVKRIEHRWAGLRTFAPDDTPVAGFDLAAPGFFWLVGQGGYGFQTADALARTTAALIAGEDLPADLTALGLSAADLAPARLERDSRRRNHFGVSARARF